MGKIVMDMSMSLDGFIAAKNDISDQPLREDGQRLHAWYFKESAERFPEAGTRARVTRWIGFIAYCMEVFWSKFFAMEPWTLLLVSPLPNESARRLGQRKEHAHDG